jgi:hypothetical protein
MRCGWEQLQFRWERRRHFEKLVERVENRLETAYVEDAVETG